MMMTDSLPLLQQTISVSSATAKPDQEEAANHSSSVLEDTHHSQVIEDLSCPNVVPLSAAELRAQLATVAVDWKPLRQCKECSMCGYDLEGDGAFRGRLHCRSRNEV